MASTFFELKVIYKITNILFADFTIKIVLRISRKTMILLNRIIFFFITLIFIGKNVYCEKTFVASFQPEIDGPISASNDVWLEFTDHIQESKDCSQFDFEV